MLNFSKVHPTIYIYMARGFLDVSLLAKDSVDSVIKVLVFISIAVAALHLERGGGVRG